MVVFIKVCFIGLLKFFNSPFLDPVILKVFVWIKEFINENA